MYESVLERESDQHKKEKKKKEIIGKNNKNNTQLLGYPQKHIH